MSSTVADRNLKGSDFSTYYAPQTAYGAINANPVFHYVRRTTGKPKTTVAYVQDESVTTDNQGVENIADSEEYTMELSAVTTKQSIYFMSTAIHGDFVSYTNTAATFAALADGFTVPAATYAALNVGDAFWLSGFADSKLNKMFIVDEKAAANKIVTTVAPAAPEAAGATVTIVSNKCKNGLAATYLTIQGQTRTSTDPIYDTYYDHIINTYSLEIGETGISQSSINTLGERKLDQTTPVVGQTIAPRPTDRAVSNSKDILDWYVDGISAKCIQKSLSLSIDNGYSGDDAAGCVRQYARGQFAVTGSASFRAKLSNPTTWKTYYEQGIRKSMGVLMRHQASGDQTYIAMPQTCITEHNQADGSNDVANHEVSFGAEGNAAADATIIIYTNWTVTP